jgi:hypothetical protein
MTVPAQRMRKMRASRRIQNLREVRLAVPDARQPSVRRRIAAQVARLGRRTEDDALDWIAAVSEFDERDGSGNR